jgi:hypothetical protein
MQRIRNALVIAAVLSLPLVSHADNAAPLSRAELIAAEQAGQLPQSNAHYPNAQPNAARAYVANKAVNSSAYGRETSGGFASGIRSERSPLAGSVRPPVADLYRHH